MSLIQTGDDVIQDWKTIFPDFSTIQGSCLFVKKLIAVSLSAITYFRGIFPERAYGDRKLGGIKLKVLSEESGCESVSKFIELIRSCYDAVDKKYLQQLNIGICRDPKNRDEVIEAYSLMFRYSDEESFVACNKQNVPLPVTSNDPTVQATLMMLKHIHAVDEVLDDVPKNSYLTFKLLYDDEVTPPDYEPEGFQPSDTEKFVFPATPLKLSLGKVETKLSGYKLYIKSVLHSDRLSVMMNSQENGEQNMLQTSQDIEKGNSPEPIIGKKEKLKAEYSRKHHCCPCNCSKEEKSDIIACTICDSNQHKPCYGILTEKDIPDNFYCIYCFPFAVEDGQDPDIVYTTKSKAQQNLCTMRRAILLVSKLKSMTLGNLEKHLGCKKPLAKTIMEQLVVEEILVKRGFNRYTVDEEKLEVAILNYFPNKENQENMGNAKKSTAVSKQSEKRKSKLRRSSIESSAEDISSKHPSTEYEYSFLNEEVEALGMNDSQEDIYPQRKRKSTQEENDSDELFNSRAKKRKCQESTNKLKVVGD